MKQMIPYFNFLWLIPLTLLIFTFGCGGKKVSTPSEYPTLPADTSETVYRISSRPLKDSKWGKAALFQKGLLRELGKCGQDFDLKTDGILGNATQTAIRLLERCPRYEPIRPEDGRVTAGLWKKLIPNTPLPDVHERAFMLSLTHEATDYDQVEWNYGTGDDASALTWGPYGATVGHGNELTGILRVLSRENETLLKQKFGDQFSVIEELLRFPGRGHSLLKKIHSDPTSRARWKNHFSELAGNAEVRSAYDDYALRTPHWLKPAFQRLYTLIPDARRNATEVDYAFFLDLAMHMSITRQRIDDTASAIHEKEKDLRRALKPAERRRLISQTLRPKSRLKDRLGRNVVYYVDGTGESRLSEEEMKAWTWRSGLRASDVGLSDERAYYPEFL